MLAIERVSDAKTSDAGCVELLLPLCDTWCNAPTWCSIGAVVRYHSSRVMHFVSLDKIEIKWKVEACNFGLC